MRALVNERGFGLVELLIAMTILNVGILAIVAAFNSGIISLQRAGTLSTAAALADTQMELYRAATYDAIYLDTSSYEAADPTYKGDRAHEGTPTPTVVTGTCAGLPPHCMPSREVVGPDRRRHRIDTYIVTEIARDAAGTQIGRTEKKVTVVVRDGVNVSRAPFARQTSTFDCATGQTATGTAVACPTS